MLSPVRRFFVVMVFAVPLALGLGTLSPLQAEPQAPESESQDLESRLKEAGRDFEGALRRLQGSDEAHAHVVRAFAYNGLERYDLAVQEARRAAERLAQGPWLAEAYNQLGLALLRPVLHTIDEISNLPAALWALAEAEKAFRNAFAAAEEGGDGILLNLSAAMIAQYMLDDGWESWDDLDDVLRSVADLLPEHSAWAEKSLKEDPTLPGKLRLSVQASQPRRSDGGRQIYDLREHRNIHKPTGIHMPMPQYTEAARKRRVQGKVVVQWVIDEHGVPADPEIVQSLDPDLDNQAIKTMEQWRFKPATLNGEPVAVYYTLTVTFRLQ